MLKIQPYSLHTIRRWGIHPLSTLVTTPVSLRLRWPYRYLQFLQIFTTKTVQIAKIFEWEYSGNAPGSTSEDIHQKHHWHKVSLARESVILSPPKRSNRSFQYHWNPNWTCYDHVTPTYQLPLSPKRRRWQLFCRLPRCATTPKDDHQRTSSDIVHPAVGKRATNHRWYGEYQAGLITVCIKWPNCWRYHLEFFRWLFPTVTTLYP